MTVQLKRDLLPPNAATWSPHAQQAPAPSFGGGVPLTAMQRAMAERSGLGPAHGAGAVKRQRSAIVPIPSSRPVDAHPAPKRSGSAGKTHVTCVPALQGGGQGFIRCGSLAAEGMTGYGGPNLGRSSAPAALEYMRGADGREGQLSLTEAEKMESMACGSSPPGALGGTCAPAPGGGSGDDTSPQRSSDSAAHCGSAVGSLLDSPPVRQGPAVKQEHGFTAVGPAGRLHRHGAAQESGGSGHMSIGADAAPVKGSGGRQDPYLKQDPYQKQLRPFSADSGRLGSCGFLDGLGSPLADRSVGSNNTAFSGLSARFGSLHVAGSPCGSDLPPQSSISADELAASMREHGAEASMRRGISRLASTPSFGSMPMLAASASGHFMPGACAAAQQQQQQQTAYAEGAVMLSGFVVSGEQQQQQERWPQAVPGAPLLELDEHFSSPGSSYSPSVLDDLYAGGARQGLGGRMCSPLGWGRALDADVDPVCVRV